MRNSSQKLILFVLAVLLLFTFTAAQSFDESNAFDEESNSFDEEAASLSADVASAIETEATTSSFETFSVNTEAQHAVHEHEHPGVRWSTLKQLLSLKLTGGARFHRTKKEILFVSNKPGVLQLFSVAIDANGRAKGAPQQLTSTTSRCSSPRFLPDGSIMYLHDRGGDENFQIGLITRNNEHIWLTNSLKAKHLPNTFSRRFFYFTSNARDKRVMDIYRRPAPLVKHLKAKPELIYTPKNGLARAAIVLNNDKQVILEQHYSNLNSELLLLDIATKKVISLTKHLNGDKPARWVAMRFLKKDHSRLLVKTDFQSEFHRIAILEFPGGDLTKPGIFVKIPSIDQLKHDIVGYTVNYKTKSVYIELNDNGYSTLLRARTCNINGVVGPFYKVNLPLKNAVIVHGDTRTFGAGVTISKDGKFMAMTITNSVTPTAIWIMKLGTQQRETWRLLPNDAPEFARRPSNFVSESLQKIKSFDGLEVPYFLYVPKGPAPAGGWPAIIELHGGPESQTRPTFNPLVQVFVRSGFAVVAPNIRGSRGYGTTYLNLDNREKRMDAIKDIKQVALQVPKKHNINAKKLVVMGGSYGGYASLMSVVTYPELWRAGVDVVGMSNLVTFFKHTAEWRRKLRAAEYGDYETQKDLLKKISPINYVQNALCPVFIIQGSNDERVPASEAEQIYKKLQEVAKQPGKERVANSKLMIFKDEGHGLSKLKNRLVAYHKLLIWLNKHVKN